MKVGDKVVLSQAGDKLKKNEIITSGGIWEGSLTEIRDATYVVFWEILSGRSGIQSMTAAFEHKHSRNELKHA